MNESQTDYDSPWKEAVELYFERFMSFFFSDIHEGIDWLLVLPEGLEKDFLEELKAIEEDKRMPYITSVERIGIDKGVQQGIQQGLLQEAREMVIDALEVHFGMVPEDVISAVNAIEARETLKWLHRQAISSESMDAFREILHKENA